jgi:hypothetical protein
MRLSPSTLAVFLSLSILTVSVTAQQTHVVDAGSLDQALTGANDETLAKRQTIREALRQPEVQQIADSLGLDVSRADAAIATLDDGVLLNQLAAQARMVNETIAGGQTVRLNLLWIIIGLLIVILVIVAA